ncbi:hypothetical protein Tco_1142485 [Tanacetum coccineum]
MLVLLSASVNTAMSTCFQLQCHSDNTVYAFMVENPNGSNVLHQDLEQIHEDDLEAMDLKCWDTLPGSTKHQEARKVSFDWSDMVEEQVQTNMTLMAFSDSEPRIVNTTRSYRTPVNTVRPRVVNTSRPNRTSVNAARANGFNAVKPSACWVLRPIKPNSASITLNRYNYIDAHGRFNRCSRHMTGNIAYLSDFKQFDGGYVAFGGDKKVIKREYSVARILLSKMVVAEMVGIGTLIEAARHGFVVVIASYKTPYELFRVKAFRGISILRTKRVEENLHIGFLENKPMIEGTGPQWLFDIDSLTQSMNYVPVTAGTVSNDSADGLNNENAEQERFADDSSSKDVINVGQQVNTARLDVNNGSLKLNVVGPSVSTASPNEEDSTEEEPEVDLGNITNSYIVEAMQEELLQFKLQQVWKLVDLPNGKRDIGTKWVFRNKKDEKGIVIRNKERLVA